MGPGMPIWDTIHLYVFTTKPYQSYKPNLSIVAYRTLDYIVHKVMSTCYVLYFITPYM